MFKYIERNSVQFIIVGVSCFVTFLISVIFNISKTGLYLMPVLVAIITYCIPVVIRDAKDILYSDKYDTDESVMSLEDIQALEDVLDQDILSLNEEVKEVELTIIGCDISKEHYDKSVDSLHKIGAI